LRPLAYPSKSRLWITFPLRAGNGHDRGAADTGRCESADKATTECGADVAKPLSKPGGRGRRGVWFDPRFAIGLVLVLVAVAGVYSIVASSDKTTAVYSARGALAVGDRVTAVELQLTPVRLDGTLDHYLTPERMPAEGLIVQRTVSAGELLPASAVGSAAVGNVTSLVVDPSNALAGAVVPGSVVDVWSSRRAENGTFGPPAIVVTRAGVVRIVEPTGLVTGGALRSVEVLVPRDTVPAVLEAIANGDAIAVVPLNEPLGG
jgi:hypothetical protein